MLGSASIVSQRSVFDVIILGAGGAGLFCASNAAARGRSVLVLDHAKKLGGKILISGGGRCNFTNLGAGPGNYVSKNPHFCKSALARFTPDKFIALVEKHGISYHEKKLGQLFCDESAEQIVELLKSECADAGVKVSLETKIEKVEKIGDRSFRVDTSQGSFESNSLVVALGGLSIPKIGATSLGYDIAKQFGLKLVPRHPALDGFTLGGEIAKNFGDLSGVSLDTVTTCNGISFRENILFTHAGMSGPATLQASLHWNQGDSVTFNVMPNQDAATWLIDQKKTGSRSLVKNLFTDILPSRFIERFISVYFSKYMETPIHQIPDQALKEFGSTLNAWTFIPSGTVGYGKAEVTKGGVDTDELSSKTMESKKVPGLYFIGEVVDVTGWLGGYNFQWAWASAHAAAEAV